MSNSILFEITNSVAHITLNRPEVYNAINREMALKFQKCLNKCADDEEVRAIIIKGKGKAFCAGQDLKEVVDPHGPEFSRIVGEHYNPIIRKIRWLLKPIIGCVNGVAAGAGANIAIACDMVIAAESASFIQAFSKIGLIPDSGGTFFLPRLIGLGRASALMMLGDKVSAREAYHMGMIYQVVKDELLEEQVAELADQLIALPTKALGLTKRALNDSMGNDLDLQLRIEEQLQTSASQTADYKEGLAAFIEKRKPSFTGK